MEAKTLAAPRAEISLLPREPAGANREEAEMATRAPKRAEPRRNGFHFHSPAAWLSPALMTVQAGLGRGVQVNKHPGLQPMGAMPRLGQANKRAL